MDKKSNLLSHLKKQVMALKNQLEVIEHHKSQKASKHTQNSHNRSVSHSSRFDSSHLDSSYLNRGIRKFYDAHPKFKNIAQLIRDKSARERTPKFSSQRKAENEKTKLNFSNEMPEQSRSRSKSPNPLTGEGYSDRQRGKRTRYETRTAR